MKKKLLIAVMICGFLLNSACGSDDNNSAPISTGTEITNLMKDGTWRIISYTDTGTEETADFTGFNFTFGSAGVLAATNGTDTYSGSWTVTDIESDDDSATDDVAFDILFAEPDHFTVLSGTWNIQSRTESTIILIKVSSGGGGTCTLTFVKN